MSFKKAILSSLKSIKKLDLLLILELVTIAIVGAIFMQHTWFESMEKATDQALKLAISAEAIFPKDVVSKLEGNPKDLEKLEYVRIKNSLGQLASLNNNINFAYIYRKIDKKIYYVADSNLITSKDYSPQGHKNGEVDGILMQPFEDNEPLITEPKTNPEGSWVSILVPMKDFETGETIAVFGVDYTYKMWKDYAKARTIQAGFVILCLFSLVMAFYVVLTKRFIIMDEKNKLALVNEKLRVKEELFRTLFEQLPLGISFGGTTSDNFDINPMFEKISGWSKEEMAALNWTGITHPDDLQEDLDNFAKFNAGEIDGYSMNKRYIKPDKSTVWVNITIAPLKVDNESNLNHVCIVEDISERKQAEEELKESERNNAMLLSNLPGMAYRCNFDRDWTMQFVSEGCYDLTGYRPESLLQNKEITFNALINQEYIELLWNKWVQVLGDKTVFNEEYSITTANGDVKWVWEQGQGVYDSNGEVIAIEGIIMDITKRKEVESNILYLSLRDVLTGLYNRRFFDEEKKRLNDESQLPLSVIISDINGLKLINDALGHDEGDKLIVATAKILSSCCREGDVLARTGGDEFSILMPKTSNEEAYKILRQIEIASKEYKGKTGDETYTTSISLGCATKINEGESLNNVIKVAEDYMYRHKLLQHKSLHSSIISSMKTAMHEKSQETEEHAQRLVKLSKAIAIDMNLTDEQLNELELLSTLHDIGKIGIKDNILNKPGKLTEDEWIEMKKHPEIGYRIAVSSQELAPIADYILCHHERWDGKGYPQGLKDEDIPLLSRIIAIVDAYDAMTEDRPYRKALTNDDAIDEIKINSGKQFDPKIAKIFIENVLVEKNNQTEIL